MFGDDAGLGLDPNFVIDQDGRVQKIWVDNKYFVVKKLIHSVKTLIGRFGLCSLRMHLTNYTY